MTIDYRELRPVELLFCFPPGTSAEERARVEASAQRILAEALQEPEHPGYVTIRVVLDADVELPEWCLIGEVPK